MKMNRIAGEKGFTLVEIIMALTLAGIVSAGIGLAVVNMAGSYLSAKQSASTLQKGEIAIARIAKELNNINLVDAANTNQTKITFSSYRTGGTVVLSWGGTGTDLLLDGDILTDSVGNFTLAYHDDHSGAAQTTWTASRRMIEITLTLTGAQGVPSVFTARVAVTSMIGV